MSDERRDDAARSGPGRLSTLLSAVMELPPDERERWIDESSSGNPRLREQLREMLRQAEAAQREPHSETAWLAAPATPRPASALPGRDPSSEQADRDRLSLGQHV